MQISKASVKNWQSKLQTRYGWFKKENCKNIIFDVSILTSEFSFRDSTTDIDSLKFKRLSSLYPFQGPYKQYMGRSKNTGNITVVLYEDPPDGIPKIHIRSSKYMAWIAEQGMPVHMHVEKVRNIKAVDGKWECIFGSRCFDGRSGTIRGWRMREWQLSVCTLRIDRRMLECGDGAAAD